VLNNQLKGSLNKPLIKNVCSHSASFDGVIFTTVHPQNIEPRQPTNYPLVMEPECSVQLMLKPAIKPVPQPVQ
jgi:hypothetical protein